MKKILTLALVITCVLLASCGGNKIENTDISSDQVQQQTTTENVQSDKTEADEEKVKTDEEIKEAISSRKELSDKAMEVLSKIPEYPEGYPTLQDVADVYEKANMAIGWIISTEKMPYYDDDSITVNGLEYKKVRPDCHYGAHALEHHKKELGQTEKLIYDKKTLKAYLSTLINPEEAQAYMEDARDLKKIVEDEAGYLYVLPFSYVPEGYGKENYTLDDNGDGTYTFNVKYELVDENGEVYKERTEKFDFVQIDGRWVFEDFRVIRQN